MYQPLKFVHLNITYVSLKYDWKIDIDMTEIMVEFLE